MLLGSRLPLTFAAVSAIASAAVSQAAVSWDFGSDENTFGEFRPELLESNGYQPGYGFAGTTGEGPDFSDLISIVGGNSSVTGGTLTLGGNYGGTPTLTLGSSNSGTLTLSSGTLVVSGSGTLTLGGTYGFSDTLGPLTVVNPGNLIVSPEPTTWLGFSSGTATTWNSSALTILPSNLTSSLTPGTVFSGTTNLSSGALVLQLSPIPEPSALLLGGIGSLALLRRRRTA